MDKIIEKKSLNLELLDTEEAILKLEEEDHRFFVYRDTNTNHTSVAYKRNDGTYVVIQN